MKLLRLRLKDYRGIDEHEVEPDPEGVTIIQGPNEVGKSSLAEAFDLIFERKDRSTANEVDAVIPVDRDAGPEIELELTTGPYRFTYRKRFRKDAVTELTVHEPTPESLTGDDAHDRALEILEDTLDIDLWRALRVQQGTEVSQANLTDQTALSKALDRAAGGARIGEDEMALFDAVQERYETYWTTSGNPRKAYREQVKLVEGDQGLEAQVADLERRYRALEDDVERSRELEGRLEAVQGKLPELQVNKETWAERLVEVDRLDQALEKAVAEEATAQEKLKSAKQAQAQRQALVDAVQAAKGDLEAAQDDLQAKRPGLDQAKETLQEAQTSLDTAQGSFQAAKELERLRRGDVEHLRAVQRLERATSALDRARGAAQAARQARETLATIQVDDARVDELTRAEMELETLADRIEEQGPTNHLTVQEATEVTIDGEERKVNADQALTSPVAETLELHVPGVLDLTVQAGRSTEELRERLAEARRSRGELLEAAGVETLAQARDRNHARREAEQALTRAEDQRTQALDGAELEELEAAVAKLQAGTQRYPGQRAAEPPLPDDLEHARSLHREAEQALSEAEAELEGARDAREAAQARSETRRQEVQELEFRNEAATQALDQATASLAQSREAAPDEALDEALEQRAGELQAAEHEREDAEQGLEEANPEAVRAQAENAQAVLERTRREVRELEKELEKLRGSLQAREEEGLYEALEHRRAELAHARRELEATHRRARAAALLYEIMAEERSKARQAYVGPLREELERLGRIVYGEGFQVTLDEDLSIRSRTLRGRTVPYESLSVGAKEQLSILTRLACATIVAEEGGVPLLFDDALGYSDPSRLEAMGAVLATAGRECQVIVLTCMPDRYRHVGSARIERLG